MYSACTCVWGCMGGHVCLRVCSWRPKVDVDSFLNPYPLQFSFRKDISTNLELVNLVWLAGWPASFWDPSTPQHQDYLRAHAAMLSLYVGAREPDPGHFACSTVIWLTDSSPSLSKGLLRISLNIETRKSTEINYATQKKCGDPKGSISQRALPCPLTMVECPQRLSQGIHICSPGWP